MKKSNNKERLFEVMSSLDKSFKQKLNENFDNGNDEFVPNGTYTVSNTGGYEIMLNDSGDAAKVRDAYGSDNPETSDWLEIEYVHNEETGESEPVIDPNGYDIPLNQVMRMNEESKSEVVSERSSNFESLFRTLIKSFGYEPSQLDDMSDEERRSFFDTLDKKWTSDEEEKYTDGSENGEE